MSKPAAVVGSPHICPKVDPGPKPHVGGPVISAGQAVVLIDGLPVAVEGGNCLCTGMPGPDGHERGSARIRIDGRGVMRVGDTTAHGGRIVAGMPHIRFC